MAPSVVASSLKTVVLASYMLENLGYEVEPKWNEERADIVSTIIFNDKEIDQIKQIGSMAGWDVPGADPKHYEESYSGQTSCANFEQKQ
mgnify:CR=1 FL=1